MKKFICLLICLMSSACTSVSSYFSEPQIPYEKRAEQGESPRIIIRKDVNAENENFEKMAGFNHVKLHLAECLQLIEIPVGTADGNYTFGAICKTDATSNASMFCYDKMLGRFAWERNKRYFEPSLDDLKNFSMQNCFGG